MMDLSYIMEHDSRLSMASIEYCTFILQSLELGIVKLWSSCAVLAFKIYSAYIWPNLERRITFGMQALIRFCLDTRYFSVPALPCSVRRFCPLPTPTLHFPACSLVDSVPSVPALLSGVKYLRAGEIFHMSCCGVLDIIPMRQIDETSSTCLQVTEIIHKVGTHCTEDM